MKWRKLSYTGSNGGDCVEVALDSITGAVGVRDSKAPNTGQLALTVDVWATLTASIKAGRYDQC
nr:DUF397 domain-containing protein [Actinomadura macra]